MPALVIAAAVAIATCPVERAAYALRGAPAITAHFIRVDSGEEWPSGLALATTFGGSGHTYWWVPWNGGTDSLQHVASTTDVTAAGWQPPSPDDGPRPHGDLSYLGTDAAYTVLPGVPVAGAAAPGHFMLAELGDRLGNPGFGREHLEPNPPDTRQFFDLVSCRAR